MADTGDPASRGPHPARERQQAAPAARRDMLSRGSMPQHAAGADEAEKTIVVRDRRKPNQYTTDNVIAREWLPILRVGDAFFFYSVYLSMANRETESSWGSLRTQAEYLQCSVDLIVRGNKLLEICELVHIETGNQYTSNQYYILDPPPLTPELQKSIHRRLDDVARQETSKNWQSWVKQVRKALNRHRALPDIWAARRARRGGRPIKAVRPREALAPGEAPDRTDGARDSQPGFPAKSGSNGKGDRGSQPPWMWDTTKPGVAHDQGRRDSQPEQEVLTRQNEQDKERKEASPRLVREWLTRLGVARSTIESLEAHYSTQRILQQLEWLRYRSPRDPAAMLVRAVQDNWAPPSQAPDTDAPGSNGNEAVEVTQVDLYPLPPGPLPVLDATALLTPLESAVKEGLFLEGGEMDVRDAWAQLLAEMRMQMTRVTFDTWLGGTEVTGVQGEGVSVRVRDAYAVEWLGVRWKLPIERTLSGILGRPVAVRFLAPDAAW